MDVAETGARIRKILAQVRPLAVEYYKLTGKPLGVTGEVAEVIAADLLGLTLVPARTMGYDALRGSERIQIKGPSPLTRTRVSACRGSNWMRRATRSFLSC